MMTAADYRQRAWNINGGNWGVLALTMLIYSAAIAICGALGKYAIGEIIAILISGPIALSFAYQSLKLVRKTDKPSVNDIFYGFKYFANAFLAYLINGVLTFLWALLLIIPGIIKAYSYSMTFFILHDDPSMQANEARLKSMKIMDGNKWRLFCLDLSFIGWYILCIITLGILTLWIGPYHQTARALFYQSLLSQSERSDDEHDAESSTATTDDPFDRPPTHLPDPFDDHVSHRSDRFDKLDNPPDNHSDDDDDKPDDPFDRGVRL